MALAVEGHVEASGAAALGNEHPRRTGRAGTVVEFVATDP
jgi:hypothetical protein